MSVNTLYLQKEKTGSSMVSTVEEFGIYVADSMPAMDPNEAKVDGNSQDWADEDGLDVYDTDKVFMTEFEVEIPLVCTGDNPSECREAYRKMMNYITGRTYKVVNGNDVKSEGSLMMVYQPWVGYGRKSVRFKSTSNHQFWRDGNGYSVYTFTLKVEVCDPVTEVRLNSGGTGLDAI